MLSVYTGYSMWSFFPLWLFAKMDGYKDGVPYLSALTSTCLEVLYFEISQFTWPTLLCYHGKRYLIFLIFNNIALRTRRTNLLSALPKKKERGEQSLLLFLAYNDIILVYYSYSFKVYDFEIITLRAFICNDDKRANR